MNSVHSDGTLIHKGHTGCGHATWWRVWKRSTSLCIHVAQTHQGTRASLHRCVAMCSWCAWAKAFCPSGQLMCMGITLHHPDAQLLFPEPAWASAGWQRDQYNRPVTATWGTQDHNSALQTFLTVSIISFSDASSVPTCPRITHVLTARHLCQTCAPLLFPSFCIVCSAYKACIDHLQPFKNITELSMPLQWFSLPQ